MEDEVFNRRYDLSKILTQLSSLDKESCFELWDFLFDCGNNLNLDVGRVLILRSSANLTDPGSLQLLTDLESTLKDLQGTMYNALMSHTRSD
jgi:hypothetical protein